VRLRLPRRQRGQPVWQALALLMLLPLIAAAVMGGVSVVSARESAEQALRAQRLVTAVGVLDTARRAADNEVLPTMLLGTLQNEQLSVKVGFPVDRRALLRVTEPAVLDHARTATDEALAEAIQIAGFRELQAITVQARETLLGVRGAADQNAASLQVIADDYAAISSSLASAQGWASAQAIAAGLSTRSVTALQDLNQVLQLSETASRQLGELFASRVLPEPAASNARRRWVAAWGTYSELASHSGDLSTDSSLVAWTIFTNTAEVTAFSELLDRQALDPNVAVLETGALPGLADRSRRRDEALAIVLDDAVAAVTSASRVDHANAVARARVVIEIFLALLLLSLLDAGLVARWLAASMRSLAAGAQQISLGHLVDVHPRGPRELRTAARALTAAVAGLRRVQEQAQAVVAGDPEAALRQQPLPGPLGEVVHASVEQIVEAFRAREALQDELAHQASHDALTGLANRAQTLRHLSSTLEREQHTTTRTGLLFIDLDGFKAVNDTHGHAAGDEMLREVARRLSSILRPTDSVGRLGGDEFVVTIEGVRAEVELIDLGRRLIAAVSRPGPLRFGDTEVKQVRIGASIGVSISSGESTADSLLAEADLAAYRAKRHGRGRVEVFDDELRAELAERADLEIALRRALFDGELFLHYQPVVNLRTGDLVGYEALARWIRPGFGPVRPDVFIAAAEASTIVCDLGQWVLTEATAQLARWRATGLAGFGRPGIDQSQPTMAVNISGRHLSDPRVLTDVHDALMACGLPPELLIVEITETVLMDDPRAQDHLSELRARGVRVAIDDFGTGFTSISALSSTPADILKIDRSFISSDDPGHHQLATLITRAAHTYSLRVVAEGIETTTQLARVQADGCDEAQGYLFARPLPADEVERLTHPLFALAGASTTDRPPTPRRSSQ
jgi:diguanylate cyclase (GGDEF)-like protein